MKLPESFTLDQPHRYSLHKQLADKACQIAEEEGIVTAGLLKKFAPLLEMAMQFRAAPAEQKAPRFEELKKQAKLTSGEQEQLSRLMEVLVPVLNAASSVEARKHPGRSAEEIFENYFLGGVKIAKGNSNAFGMTPEAWLKAAAEAKKHLLLSLVNTAHPTNYHTPFGREYEKGLITSLQAGTKLGRPLVMDNATLKDFEGEVKSAAKRIKKGEMVTYVEHKNGDGINLGQVTVGEETETEKDILRAQKEAMLHVQEAWDKAITKVSKHMDKWQNAFTEQGDSALAARYIALQEKLEALRLTDADKTRMYEQRSWIRAGADKDGREEATDVAFYAGYKDSLDEQGRYVGPILDLRENAEVRKKLLGALIAKRYVTDTSGAFRQACDDFCNHPAELPLGENWTNNRKSLFQRLSEKNQAAFLQHLMENGHNIFKPGEMQKEALEFNEKFYDIYQSVLKNHKLDKHTPYPALLNKPGNPLEKVRAAVSRIQTQITDDPKKNPDEGWGSYKISTFYDPSTHENEMPVIAGFNYHHSAIDTLASLFVPNGHGEARKLNDVETLSCMAYLRRLMLVNHFIGEQKSRDPRFDPKMFVEREQAANFENPSDFLTQLYLFQQTGLVKIEKGKVTEAKVGIMPLFETTKEMKNAEHILGEILKSPLGESYYRARGKAEFMVGYSDGAKSGGNFASHVRIRDFERVAAKMFKEKFGADYEVRFLRGPGRGENRGGVRRYDRQYVLHHDSVNHSAVNDQTVQGDLAVRMEMDPKFAERTVAEMLVSAMAGAVEARRVKSPEEQKRTERYEQIAMAIADESEMRFQKGVFEKKQEADDLISAIPKNPNASSRRVKRANTDQKGIGPQRAITVEYATKVMGLPLHDFGLNTTLAAQNEEELREMAREFPLFREEMKLAAARQQSFNPIFIDIWKEKAAQYIEQKAWDKAESEGKSELTKEVGDQQQALRDWVKSIQLEVNGLGDRAQSLVAGKAMKARMREDYSGEPFSAALADITQGVLAANESIDKPVSQRLYFALQNAISEAPAATMQMTMPGLSLDRNRHDFSFQRG